MLGIQLGKVNANAIKFRAKDQDPISEHAYYDRAKLNDINCKNPWEKRKKDLAKKTEEENSANSHAHFSEWGKKYEEYKKLNPNTKFEQIDPWEKLSIGLALENMEKSASKGKINKKA